MTSHADGNLAQRWDISTRVSCATGSAVEAGNQMNGREMA